MAKEIKSILPLELLYNFLSEKKEVEIIDKEAKHIYKGMIVGFDEYMNITFDSDNKRFLIKGDCISAVRTLE